MASKAVDFESEPRSILEFHSRRTYGCLGIETPSALCEACAVGNTAAPPGAAKPDKESLTMKGGTRKNGYIPLCS